MDSNQLISGRPLDKKTDGLPNEERVSVIIPCYKQAEFLKEAIESVLVQTYRNFEILVVDDGSPDDIEKIVRQYPPVKLLRQPNAGAAIARNNGIRNSTGSYLIFLDSDDRLLPGALLTGVAFLTQNPALAFVTGHVKLIDAKGNFLEIPSQPTVKEDHYRTLLRSNYIWTPGVVMYRRSVFDGHRGFDPRAGGSADYELNIRLARTLPVGCHGKVVLEYRQHGTNMSGRLAYMLKSGVDVRRKQYKYVKKDGSLLNAWKRGIKIVQEDVGERLLKQVHTKMKDPALRKGGFDDLMYLLKYYPKGFIKFFLGRGKPE